LAADVVRRFDDPQLRLSFDCYHQQRTAATSSGDGRYYGYNPTFHIGDWPTRRNRAPARSTSHISTKLDELGYDGLIGMECYPSTTKKRPCLHPEIISRAS